MTSNLQRADECVDEFDADTYETDDEAAPDAELAPDGLTDDIEPTGYLSCGMPYWHPEGLTLDEINARYTREAVNADA